MLLRKHGSNMARLAARGALSPLALPGLGDIVHEDILLPASDGQTPEDIRRTDLPFSSGAVL